VKDRSPLTRYFPVQRDHILWFVKIGDIAGGIIPTYLLSFIMTSMINFLYFLGFLSFPLEGGTSQFWNPRGFPPTEAFGNSE